MNPDNHMNPEFTGLWRLIKSGDQVALGDLFKKTNHRMFNYGYKIVEEPEMIKDAIQDVFITIWKRRDHLTDVKSVPAYLFVSLKRRLYRLVQNQNRYSENDIRILREHSIFLLHENELLIKGETDPGQVELIRKSINDLAPQKREVVYLFFYNGMDYEEISQIMDLDIQTVRNYMSMALKRIRKLTVTDHFTGI